MCLKLIIKRLIAFYVKKTTINRVDLNMIEYIALPNPTITLRDIHNAARLVDNSFANGYFKNHLSEIQCAWIVLKDKEVIGWASVCRDKKKSEGVLRCVVVDPRYRGMGIGRTLTEKRLEYLDDCDRIISYAWVRPDGTCMSCKNLENFGFSLQEELIDHYNDTRSQCKYCGSSCTCVARLYVKSK